MTAPISNFVPAKPVSTPVYWVFQIVAPTPFVVGDNPQPGVDSTVVALAYAVQQGWITNGFTESYLDPTSTLVWRVKLTNLDHSDSFAYAGDWIVVSNNGIAFYAGSETPVTPSLPSFADNFTVPTG